MKNLMVIIALSFSVSGAYAQKIKESEVPSAVKEGFNKHFPNSKAEKWEKEEANYEAEFDLNKVETSALMDVNGNLLETESEISVKDLPKGAVDYLAKNAAGQKIKEAAKIVDAKGTITYEAEAGEADYIFDSTGNFIKKEVEKDKKDDDKKEKKK